MATAGVLSERGYGRLLLELRGILERGRAQAEVAVGQVLVGTYWELGQRLLQEELSARAGYGDGMIEELAMDLGLSRTAMFRIVAFAKAYPRRLAPGLTWSQHVDLLSVKSDEARRFYVERALADGWTRRQLQQAIRQRAFALEEQAGKGKGKRGKGPARPTETTHVYAVEVTRVIDADTVVVEIDLGFDVIRRQKMRLAGVDAAAAGTAQGRAAARFVRERLAAAEVVAVKTERREDVHGRYVGHLFYVTTPSTVDEAFRGGRYLNAELVDSGHAVLA